LYEIIIIIILGLYMHRQAVNTRKTKFSNHRSKLLQLTDGNITYECSV